MRERVFVDTSAYYALIDQDDANHHVAVAAAQRLSQEGVNLHTSNFVVAESHTLLLNRLGRDVAARVLAQFYTSATRTVRATEADERQGREIIARYQDKSFSLVDAISFAIMDRLHIRRSWTYDQHFRQYGYLLEP